MHAFELIEVMQHDAQHGQPHQGSSIGGEKFFRRYSRCVHWLMKQQQAHPAPAVAANSNKANRF
ncbi:hypothetical protein AC781_09920 [Akkermansia glycaniphila]|nr:hypothetical protein AC781_09920 [Akkermansia glycaniphila]